MSSACILEVGRQGERAGRDREAAAAYEEGAGAGEEETEGGGEAETVQRTVSLLTSYTHFTRSIAIYLKLHRWCFNVIGAAR